MQKQFERFIEARDSNRCIHDMHGNDCYTCFPIQCCRCEESCPIHGDSFVTIMRQKRAIDELREIISTLDQKLTAVLQNNKSFD